MVDVRDDRDVAGGHAELPDQKGGGWAGQFASVAPAITDAPIGQARLKGKPRHFCACCTAAIVGETVLKRLTPDDDNGHVRLKAGGSPEWSKTNREMLDTRKVPTGA